MLASASYLHDIFLIIGQIPTRLLGFYQLFKAITGAHVTQYLLFLTKPTWIDISLGHAY